MPTVFAIHGNSLFSNNPPVTTQVQSITNAAAPLWPATITFGTQAAFTPGTWTGNISANRQWIFFLKPASTGITGTTNYTGNPPNTIALHTPQAPAVAGDTIYIQETVYDAATGLVAGTSMSLGKVIQAAVVPLTATQAVTGIAWNVNETIAAVTPVTANGGTVPYVFSISPNLPSGLTLNTASGQITGTPLTAASLTTHTVTVTDNVSATANNTFTETTSPVVVVTPLTLLTAVNNAGLEASSLPSAANTSYTGQTITGSDGVVRHQRFTNFEGVTGNTAYLARFKSGDGKVSTWYREELDWYHSNNDPETYTPATDYWMSFAIRFNEWPGANSDGNDRQIIWQMHPNPSGSDYTDVAPNLYLYTIQDTNRLIWARAYSSTNPTPNRAEGEGDDFTETRPASGTWIAYVVHYRGGWTTAQSPQTEIWRRIANGAYVKIVSKTATTDFNAFNETLNSFQKVGLYKYNENWNGVTTRSIYHSEQFRQQGTNLFANAAESVKNFT